MGSIHKTDLRLIRYLQEHPRATIPTVSRAMGISEATTRRRVEAMFEAGIITSCVIPDVYRLGFRASAFVALKVDLTRLTQIVCQLRTYPEVTTVAEIMGHFDVMVFVAQPTIQDLRQFVTDRIATLQGVRETETWIAPRVVKMIADWRVPIDAPIELDRGRLEEQHHASESDPPGLTRDLNVSANGEGNG